MTVSGIHSVDSILNQKNLGKQYFEEAKIEFPFPTFSGINPLNDKYYYLSDLEIDEMLKSLFVTELNSIKTRKKVKL